MSKPDKSLTDRIRENALELPNLGRSNRNRALFLSHQGEIQKALNTGWSAKAVWLTLHKEGLFPATYCCFLLYVKKFIDKSPVQEKENTPDNAKSEVQTQHERGFPVTVEKKDSRIPKFQHVAIPSKDLI